jgi:hypothetical protein
VSTSAATTTEDATVHAALARLSDRDREVLLLVEWEGLRPAELATVLGCREVTARGRLHRARRRFRDAFEAGVSQDGGRERGRNGDAGHNTGGVSHAAEPRDPVGRHPNAVELRTPALTRHPIARTAMRKAKR